MSQLSHQKCFAESSAAAMSVCNNWIQHTLCRRSADKLHRLLLATSPAVENITFYRQNTNNAKGFSAVINY